MKLSQRSPGLIKPLLATALCAPLVWLGWLVYLDTQVPGTGLGPDAGETLVHYLGQWSIRVLLLAFAMTSLRHWTGQPGWVRSRRMVGLFASAYVALHIGAYLLFYLGLDIGALLEDVIERPYITMGMLAFACLLPMTITSTTAWRRRLRENWTRLHRLIYVALTAALIHLWWLTRDGYLEVVIYATCFAILCAERIFRRQQARVLA